MAGLVRTLREGDSIKVNGVTFTVWKIKGFKTVVQTDAPRDFEIRVHQKGRGNERKQDSVNAGSAGRSEGGVQRADAG